MCLISLVALVIDMFWPVKMGTSGKMYQKKWHFECRNGNFKTTFISPTSLKNDGIAVGFKRFPLLDGFSAHLEMLYFLDHF